MSRYEQLVDLHMQWWEAPGGSSEEDACRQVLRDGLKEIDNHAVATLILQAWPYRHKREWRTKLPLITDDNA